MNKTDSDIISKYLIRHFPVKRIKSGKRFRRGFRIINTVNGLTTTKEVFIKNGSDKFTLNKIILNEVSLVLGYTTSDNLVAIISKYINR